MLPGERDNARNSARCTQARKTKHGLDGQHQDVDMTPRGRVNQNDKRAEINGESSLRPWCCQPSFWLKNRTAAADACYFINIPHKWFLRSVCVGTHTYSM